MSQIFTGHEALPNGGRPLVERVMTDGMTWHRITFYGEDGERVLVESPIQDSLSIQGNQAVLMLDDSSFIPEEDTQDESMEYVESGFAGFSFQHRRPGKSFGRAGL